MSKSSVPRLSYKSRKRLDDNRRRPSTLQPPVEFKPTHKGDNKINLDYLETESQVQHDLKTRYLNRENSIECVDTDVAFFTDAIQIPLPDSDETRSPVGSDKTQNLSLKSESPTHVASSYLQIDELPVTEKYESVEYDYNTNELFYPATEVETVEFDVDKVRNVADEGLFVKAKPKIKPSNRGLLINRLIEDGSFHFLDDGNNLRDLQIFQSSDTFQSESNKMFCPIFVAPTPLLGQTELELPIPDDKMITIYIQSLQFTSHYLFNEEQIVAKHIETLYDKYRDVRKKRIIETLEHKLESLRAMRGHDTDPYDDQIKSTRKQLHKEEKTQRNQLKNILEQWKKLKLLRERQKYATTNLKIQIVQVDVDEAEDSEKWSRRFDQEFDEVIAEADWAYKKSKDTYKIWLEQDGKGQTKEMKKPQKPDLDELKSDLFALYRKTVRGPGEPKLYVELLEDKEVLVKKLENFEQYKYFLKIVIDDEVVTTSKHCGVKDNDHVDFDAKYSVRLVTRIMKNIKIEIFEQSKYKMIHKISELFLPIPEDHELIDTAARTSCEFSSDKLKINGEIHFRIGWSPLDGATISEGGAVAPKKSNIQLSQTLLDKWHADGTLNPLDPESQHLVNVVRRAQQSKASNEEKSNSTSYRFNEDRLAFCSADELNNNERFNLLIARFNRDLRYKSLKFVPQMEREIEVDDAMQIVDTTIGMDQIDLQRHRGKRYLKSVYSTLTNYCENLVSESRNANILMGDELPSFGIFGPKRPLKPNRKSPTVMAIQRPLDVYKFNIIVTVIRAFGIPTRNDDFFQANRRNSAISTNKQASKGSTVRPFLSINLNQTTVRTSTAEGVNPTWNEQLTIPLNMRTDQSKKFLTFDLFDEFVEDLLEDDRARTTELYQRITSKWLGEFKIPICTIYANHRIEGTVEIKTPPILLGYNKSPDTASIGGLPDMRELTHLSLFVSLEPVFEVPKLITTGLECTELAQTKAYIDLWLEELALEIPERIRTPLVTTLDGKRVCITRLLGAITIPFPKDDSAECLVRRFVSLIPLYQNFDHCTDLNGIWLNNEQILNCVCATPKDLGVLLACFYAYLDYEMWLIVGHALTSGDTCHVLLKLNDEYIIVDPETGKKYSSKDIYLPLTKVYYVANTHNVWANIQKESRVFMTVFDVRKSRFWKPLFDKSHPAPVGVVHNLNFMHKKSNHIKDLTKAIELKIMKKVSSWRMHRKTTWNRFVSDQLKKVLVNLETDECYDFETDRHMDHLSQLSTSFKAHGFPLHTAYTTLSQIVAMVKNTGIYLNSDTKVEFALSVYIKELTNNILSVWIFLVSLSPKNP